MMTPPPYGDGTNSNDDDPLGGMDPMAWLESLARRQGANPDELTTQANIEIPVLPPDTKVDEPGYTPGYESAKPKPAAAPTPPAPVAKAPEPPPAPPPAPVAAAADDPFNGMDPMAWLESLAKRQGANPDELTTQANIEIPILPPDTKIDEPGYTPGYESAKPKPAAPPPAPVAKVPEPPKPPPPAPTPAPVAAASDDPLGGMDPMAWLESLAKRQGANPDELTTQANIEIPILPPDTKIDEPGYTPGYESAKPKPAATATPAAAPVAKAPEPPKPPPPAPTPAPVAAASDDPLGGMDPMAWLESLAMRQGGNRDEMTTQANIEIPILPPDTKIDEPGYTPFDPFSAGGVSQSARNLEKPAPTPPPAPEPSPAPTDLADSLAWLDQLSKGQGDLGFLGGTSAPDLGANDPMAWLNSLSGGADMFGSPAESPTAPPPIGTSMSAEDALSFLDSLAADSAPPPPAPTPDIREAEKGGLSNDPAEIQAWLMGQQAKLEEVRQLEDVEPYDPNAPATAGEMPDWMRQMVTDTPAPAPTIPPLDTKIALPIPPSDILPDWLMPSDDAESLLGDDLGIPATPAPVAVVLPPAPAQIEISAEDLAAFTQPESADDDWAEALDSEYERKLAGDDSVPEWYLEALTRADEGIADLPSLEPAISTAPSLAELDLEPATPGEIPDWMSGFAGAPPAATPALETTLEPLAQGQLPDWLAAITPAETAPAAPPMPDWLRAQTGALDPAKVVEPPPPPAPTPEPIAPPPPVVVEVAKPAPAPVVEPPKPAPRPIVALGAVLGAARQLIAKRELAPALEQYQQLIDNSTNLEEARGDLRQLAAEHPKEPKIMRLLGDAHMRLGDLQAALETYLNALDKM